MTQAATSASAPDGYLRTTGASTSQTAGTTWVWASTTTRISPFEYTRALRRSYPPECGTVRPSNRTVVGKGRSLPGLRTSLTRIAPSLQKNTSPAVPPAIAATAILGRSTRTSWPCWIFASSIRSLSFKPWDWAVTRASISSPRSSCDVMVGVFYTQFYAQHHNSNEPASPAFGKGPVGGVVRNDFGDPKG